MLTMNVLRCLEVAQCSIGYDSRTQLFEQLGLPQTGQGHRRDGHRGPTPRRA
jgi:hypothetical protein